MSTLGELRALLRVLLDDNRAGSYLWSDESLGLWIGDAVRDYSRFLPREMESTVATVAGQWEYDLPAGCGAVVRVEVVEDGGGVPLPERGAGGDGYELWGGRLILSPAPTVSGRQLSIRYLAAHAPLVAGTDVSTLPSADEDLLLAFASARALQFLSLDTAKRQRFEERSGQPVESAARVFQAQYERGIKARRSRAVSRQLSAVSSGGAVR